MNDRSILAEIEAGALEVDDVAIRCGAGTRCGSCVPVIEAMLALAADAFDEAAA